MEAPDEPLLAWLRARLGPWVTFAAAPVRLTGGFDTTTMAFALDRAPAELPRDLILRILPAAAPVVRVRREVATHEALVGAGFPAPRIYLHEEDPALLGGAFIVMERLPGTNMWEGAMGRSGEKQHLLTLSRRLAEAQAPLHRIDGKQLIASAQSHGIDPALLTLAGEVARIRSRMEKASLGGLLPGVEWLQRNLRRPAEAEVICHGDFHPLNIMVQGERLVGVIDWPQAIVAEPAYDVASTLVLLRFADAGLTGAARTLFDLFRMILVRRYLSAYRRMRPFREDNLAYYEALRVLSALTYAGEHPPGPGNPWSKPHVLSALYHHFEAVSDVKVRV
jgi:aminoglycoside phosphotransferase (APT) family kinase protein